MESCKITGGLYAFLLPFTWFGATWCFNYFLTLKNLTSVIFQSNTNV